MNATQVKAIRNFFAAIRMAGGDVTFVRVTRNATSLKDVAVGICTDNRVAYAFLVDVDGTMFTQTDKYILIEDIQDAVVW